MPVAASTTWLASTVTVTVSPSANAGDGASVYSVGPPRTVAVCSPLVLPEMVNQVPVTSTGVLNLIVRPVLPRTLTAPLAGVVAATAGSRLAAVLNVRSSIAMPSSLPLSSTSLHRSTSV